MPRLSRQYHHRCHLLFHHDCLSSSLSSKSSSTSLSSSSSPSFNQRPRCRFGVKVLREPLWDPGLLQLLLLIEYSINVFVFADLYFCIFNFYFCIWIHALRDPILLQLWQSTASGWIQSPCTSPACIVWIHCNVLYYIVRIQVQCIVLHCENTSALCEYNGT